jgi:hypothetical protein
MPQGLTSMRPIARRLWRLEARFTPLADPEAGRLVALLRERMGRHGLSGTMRATCRPGTISTERSLKSCARFAKDS